ncbi:MAG: LysR family transcriptional regulator [Gammaproteobacteria bacterium]|jgi:DNA-binding transcriptional LysR family regulator
MDKLTSMQAYLQVARLGSFSAAAEAMGLSKAMVSRRIGRLESELGVQLINRTTRHLSLTEVGVAYRDRVREIFNDIEETELAVSTLSSEPRGTLRIMAPTSFGSFHLTRAIADYRRIYRHVSIDLILTERTPDLIEEGLDMAIRIGSLDDSSMVARKLAESRSVVCAAPEYLENHGTPREPAELVNHNCLIYTPRQPTEQWQFQSGGEVFDTAVRGDIRSNVVDALRIAAIRGCGLAQLPAYAVGLDVRADRLRAVLEDYAPPARPIHGVYLHRRHLSAKVRTFVDFLVKRFEPVPYWEQWTRE